MWRKCPLKRFGAKDWKAEQVGERQIRDLYAARLSVLRPDERLVKTEFRYSTAARRVDMRTIDRFGVFREWEFKVSADHRALGQLLIYLAHARRELDFRPVRGVIAALSIPDELRLAGEVMSLNIEFVTIPTWMRAAGAVPDPTRSEPKPSSLH
jgi:RecB family endonuclease NucS